MSSMELFKSGDSETKTERLKRKRESYDARVEQLREAAKKTSEKRAQQKAAKRERDEKLRELSRAKMVKFKKNYLKNIYLIATKCMNFITKSSI